jgi:fructuronate reductase
MRLSLETLARLPPQVRGPAFDPRSLGCGIVHLGIGAFHRAHQAVYTQEALARAPGPWGIVGVSLQSPDTRDRLAPQDCLYAVLERGPDGEGCAVVGAVRGVLFAPEAPPRVVERIADPATRIVSLTVTEKGYCHDPATGRLREDDPGVAHDLAHPAAPRTAVGMLVRGLAARCSRDAGGVTVLCCDNLPHNGRMLRGIARRFAERVDPDLAAWIDANVTFPCTMVDRIVPAATPADLDAVERILGLRDEAAVVAEPFRQWVIEDRFAAGRPAWEEAGAELVADVAPYEEMKLRLLNGSHSALAYLGYLAGHEYIYQAMAQPDFARFMRALMDEASPTLRMPAGVDVAAYKAALTARFANAALKHRTWQIAMDGSQKLPQRLLGTARDNLAAGRSVACVALAVAAWMRYATAVDEAGRPIEVKDPLAARLRRIAGGTRGDPAAQARAYLGVREVFDDDLPRAPAFADAVAAALARLYELGAAKTVAAALT